MSVSNEKIYQILGIKSNDVTYPCCINCYKKVFYISQRKKWNCTSCNEDFNKVNHRFKLLLEITNFSDFKQCSIFGKPAEIVFGVESNNFNKYKNKMIEKYGTEDWACLLENAFRFCFLGRWFIFDLKEIKNLNKTSSFSANCIKIPKSEAENFITIYSFFRNRANIYNEINLSDSFSFNEKSDISIIDETFNDEADYEQKNLCKLIENFTIIR
ncbi:unnamed protein product [Brachionus calyciflorus]|uniref:Replication factor A C-terminal domain-containing protein n=1 Tax=Brachionus calyciflorus TaxID=104777 RepID=A0A813W5V0_9BILA|nr:unnamed protein product [Brachionus calyciflorus]